VVPSVNFGCFQAQSAYPFVNLIRVLLSRPIGDCMCMPATLARYGKRRNADVTTRMVGSRVRMECVFAALLIEESMLAVVIVPSVGLQITSICSVRRSLRHTIL
jgi:hypothetical protein